jgi:hypothetical protein
MTPLLEFIQRHVEAGECTCGRCGPVSTNPGPHRQDLADLVFFKVAKKGEPNAVELIQLIKAHKGDFVDLDLFDGGDHSYINVGGWIGDQGAALMLMGLGSLMGLWELRTPYTMIDPHMEKGMANAMASAGWVTVCFTNNDPIPVPHDIHKN